MSILDAREKRDELERRLISKYSMTLLTLRANFPGEDKRHPLAAKAVEILLEEVRRRFTPVHEDSTSTSEGLIKYLLLREKPEDVKRAAVELEESHALGRLLDLDVRDGEKIWSRRDLGLPERRCFLCKEPAVHCVRSMKHSLGEVRGFFIGEVEKYLSALR